MDKPDRDQIMFSAHWVKALQEVGLFPEGVYTAEGVTVRIGMPQSQPVVMMDVHLLLPFNKFKAALEVVERLREEERKSLWNAHSRWPRETSTHPRPVETA